MLNILRCEEVDDTGYGVFDAVSALRGRPGAEGSQCRYGYNDVRSPDFHYCPATAERGSSYCPEHHKLCTPLKG